MSNRLHAELVRELQRLAAHEPGQPAEAGNSYAGTTKPFHPVSTPDESRAVKGFRARDPDLALPDYLALLDDLYQGRTHNDISLAGKLLALWPALRRQVEPRRLDRWLDHVEGWGETDSICQSVFAARELLARWGEWQALLDRLAADVVITLVVQINGKVRDRLEVPADISAEDAKALALASDGAKRHVNGKQVQDVIYVPGRLVNIMVR